MRKGEACIGYDGGGGVCVCVWGGGGGGGAGFINILYPWKSTDEYPIALLYIPCIISIFIFFNIHKSNELGFKYITSLVVKCQISHTP